MTVVTTKDVADKLEHPLGQQFKLIEMLSIAQISKNSPPSTSLSGSMLDKYVNNISEFIYDSWSNVIFDIWIRRYENMFNADFGSTCFLL